MVEARDGVTGQHIKHTSAYVEIIANALKERPRYQDSINNSYIAVLCEAATLHDIGKISISDVILNAPRKLTPEEFEIMKTY